MKKKIKINFLHQGGGFNKEDNFFTNLLRKKYEVVISDAPDYVFSSVYDSPSEFSNKIISPLQNDSKNSLKKFLKPLLKKTFVKNIIWLLVSKKIIGRNKLPEVKGNFVKIFYTHENIVPDMDKCDWAFTFCHEDQIKNSRNMRLPYYFVALDGKSMIKEKIDFKKIKEEKQRFCNFIYKAHFPLRNKFFRKLSKYKRVDAPGKCMNNMPPIGSFKDPLKSRAADNWLDQKQDFLKKYKFTIAFENAFFPGYTTEKIVQPMLANSIPIYWGNPQVVRDFNKKSFINVGDFKNFKEVIKRIKEIDSNDKLYEKILREPWLNENKSNKWMSEEKILKQFEKIIK
jgi:alpha(1,3/1,4) fucosyltransferase